MAKKCKKGYFEKNGKCKKEMSFIQVLNNPQGKKTVEAIEHIGEKPKDKILKNIRKNLIKELKEDYGYTYRDN
jgi:hypothetical protein